MGKLNGVQCGVSAIKKVCMVVFIEQKVQFYVGWFVRRH